jgi:hypothetical protein
MSSDRSGRGGAVPHQEFECTRQCGAGGVMVDSLHRGIQSFQLEPECAIATD